MRKIFFFFLLLITTGGAFAQKPGVEFRADAPEAVIVGQQFRLAYTVNAEAKDLRLQGEMPDFDVLMGPSQSTSYSTRYVNGQSTSETIFTFTYILVAKKEGTFNLPPATVKVNNATYTSNARVVKVLPPDEQPNNNSSQQQGRGGGNATAANGISNDDLFIRMQVSKQSVYEQEGFLVTLKLYASSNIPVPQPTKFDFPDYDGFLVQEVELPEQRQWQLENYKNRNYRTVTLQQVILMPQRSGSLSIKPAQIDVSVQVPVERRVQSIFDIFDDSYRRVSKTLKTAPATIEVKPLPSGKPAAFSGGVGDFTMTSEISTNQLKANEAVTVTVNIKGTGNLRLIKNPEVQFPNDFEVYDPKITQNTRNTAGGVTGSKTIEYVAIPRFGGEFEIPAIQFSYFDLKSNSYKTIRSESYKLHVEKGEGDHSAGPVVSNFNNRESVKFLGQDIRFLKVKGINFVSNEDIFFGSFIYYLCYLIPALLFIAFFFMYRKQVRENANIALVRTKKANKMAVRRLKNAGKLLNENKKEEFYEEVLKALWGYLSDKLSISQSNLAKDNVEIELAKYGVDTSLIEEFMDILNTCEFARYAPSQASDAMDKLYRQTVDAIGKMENTIKK